MTDYIKRSDAIHAVLHNEGQAAVAAVQEIEPITKIYGYTIDELILFAEMCKRNDVREEDLKQVAWNLEFAVRAVLNERQEIIKNTMDEIAMRFTPDFEKAYAEMMGKEQNE